MSFLRGARNRLDFTVISSAVNEASRLESLCKQLATMNAGGYRIKTLFASGGDARNPLFLREHADITGCRVVLPKEPEAVLLGAAILGAVASGDQPSVLSAMGAMSEADRVIAPAGGAVAGYHAAKHRVFQRMYEDQMAYRALMAGAG